jgi:hypothetical protein
MGKGFEKRRLNKKKISKESQKKEAGSVQTSGRKGHKGRGWLNLKKGKLRSEGGEVRGSGCGHVIKGWGIKEEDLNNAKVIKEARHSSQEKRIGGKKMTVADQGSKNIKLSKETSKRWKTTSRGQKESKKPGNNRIGEAKTRKRGEVVAVTTSGKKKKPREKRGNKVDRKIMERSSGRVKSKGGQSEESKPNVPSRAVNKETLRFGFGKGSEPTNQNREKTQGQKERGQNREKGVKEGRKQLKEKKKSSRLSVKGEEGHGRKGGLTINGRSPDVERCCGSLEESVEQKKKEGQNGGGSHWVKSGSEFSKRERRRSFWGTKGKVRELGGKEGRERGRRGHRTKNKKRRERTGSNRRGRKT